MAGRNADIKVTVRGDADFGAARREAKDALDDIEREAKDVKLSPELDTADIRKAIALAEQLDGMVATLDIDADPADIVQAEKLARSLRGFQARVDLSVEGKAELTEALGLADKMEGLRKVRVEVQGRQDLERAQEIADDLERRRTVQVDVDDSELRSAGDKLEASLDDAGEAGADSIADHLGDIDFQDIGASGLDQLTGALGAVGPWGAVAASIGALFGDSLLEGFSNGFTSGRADVVRQLRTTLTGPEVTRVGEAAGQLYRDGFGESLSQLKDVAALITDELGDVDAAIDGTFNLDEATRSALTLAEVFEVDLADSVAAVGKLLSSGLVESSEDGFAVLFDLADLTGQQFGEALEVVTEFSSALTSLGIDGAQGIDLIGQAIEMQLFPQIDQAGEVFEEFNEIIRLGDAEESLAAIGLSAKDMQDALARGDGAAAMALIAERLLALPDPAERAALAAEIFGGNMALVSDPDIALGLFAQADGFREVGDGINEANKELEAANPNLEQFKRGLTEGAADGASALNDALGVLSEGLVDFVDKMTGGAVSAESLAKAVGDGPPKMQELTDASGDLADGLDGAAASADELEAELRGLFDFSADQLLRDIADAADDLAASFEDGAGKAVGLGGAIDISTDSGRRLQDQMEGLTDQLIDAQVAAANNEITAGQLADTQSFLASEFDRVTGAAGLTKDQVEGLRQKYLSVPGQVTTNLTANTATAIGNVTALQNAIANIRSKSVTISASISGPTGISASGTITRKARGGWTEGLTLVGEEGPELIDVKGRAFVHTAAETRDLMSNRGGALGGGAPVAPAGRSFIQNATIVVDKGVDVWQQLQMAELVYSGGRR